MSAIGGIGYIPHLFVACRRCSNYIFMLQLTLGFNILRQENCKPRREAFKFWDLVLLY